MSFLSLSAAVKARWVAQWTHTGTAYDNSVFSPATNAAWARLSVRPGGAFQASLGPSSLDRHAGVVIIQIFVPLLQGNDKAAWLADKAAAIFRKVTIPIAGGSAVFGVPYVVQVETGGDDWFQTNVNCPYTADVLT